jgi:tetratricopeptide (TPR) repeat protein
MRLRLHHFNDNRRLLYAALRSYHEPRPGEPSLDTAIAAWRACVRASAPAFPAEFAADYLAESLVLRGKLRREAGDERGAVLDWEEAFALGTRSSAAGERLTDHYFQKGDLALAVLWAEKTLARSPRNPFARYALGMFALQKGRFEEAERWFGEGVEIAPFHPEFRLQYAVSLAAQGKLGKAEEQLRVLVRDYPDQVEGLILLGQILKDQGRPAEARKFLDRARGLDPRHPMLGP